MVRAFVAVALVLVAAFASAGVNVWTTNGPPGAVSALALTSSSLAIYAGVSVGGRGIAFRSLDHGESWHPIGETAPNTSISALLTDPNHLETLYGTTAAVGTTIFDGLGGNAYRSLDRGSTWELRGPISWARVHSLAIHSVEPDTLFGAGIACRCVRIPCISGLVCGAGFLRSRDAGARWFLCTAGILGTKLTAVATDPIERSRVLAGGDRGVFVSDDQADHWSLSNSGLESCPFIQALAVRPSDGAVFAAAGKDIPGSFGCGGVYRSADGGRTWAAAGLPLRFVTSLAIDPVDPKTIYAGTSRTDPQSAGGVFRSVDGSESWSPLGSIPGAPDVSQVVVEPSGMVIHAGTSAGVFDYEIVPGARPPVIQPRDRETRVLPSRP
jgi:photosystem II stability/assembly factor-like uncharacterized protein